MIDAFRSHLTELAWIMAIASVAWGAVLVVRHKSRRLGAQHADFLVVMARAEKALVTVVIVAAIRIAMIGFNVYESGFVGAIAHALSIAFIAAFVWLAIEALIAVEGILLARFAPAHGIDVVSVRRARTQVTLVRRLLVSLVVVLGAGAILMTFPAIRIMGQGLLASAGLISIVAGLAAQASLTNVFAGIQLTLSNSLRVGDIVSIGDESGVVGEITLTYVVVHLWDERRLILPSSWFLTNPYENWTRRGGRIIGVFFVDVAWSVALDELRRELVEWLVSTPLWDGRSWSVTVSEITGGRVRLRVSVSARTTGDMFALNGQAREMLVRYLAAHGGMWTPGLGALTANTDAVG